MTYNLTAVQNSTGYDTLFIGVDSLVNNLYSYFFIILIGVFIFAKVEGDAATKAVVSSFSVSAISAFMFFAGVVGESVVLVCGALLFLSLIWKLIT